MNDFKDYYKILQVDFSAEKDIIEAAYKKLCKKYHPDINKNAISNDKIKLVNIAYETLTSPAQRIKYDVQWLQSNKSNFMIADILYDYFKSLARKDYETAYGFLSYNDKMNISYEDFKIWQSSVSDMYQIIDCAVDNKNYLLDDNSPFILKYKINLIERNMLTNEITEEKSEKKIIYEDTGWKVILGYKDVKPLITKFQCLSMGSANSNGLGRVEFVESLKLEHERCRRHKRVYSIVLLKVLKASNPVLMSVINNNIRITDSFSILNHNTYIFLLPETDEYSAVKFCLKISKVIEDFFEQPKVCSFGYAQYTGQSPRECIMDAKKSLKKFIQI